MTDERKLLRTCRHEAAHGGLAFTNGFRVVSIDVTAKPGGILGLTTFKCLRPEETMRQGFKKDPYCVFAHVSGIVATYKAGGRLAGTEGSDTAFDDANIAEYRAHWPSHVAPWAEVLVRAEAILTSALLQHRAGIEGLAQCLKEHHILDGVRLQSLLRFHLTPRPRGQVARRTSQTGAVAAMDDAYLWALGGGFDWRSLGRSAGLVCVA